MRFRQCNVIHDLVDKYPDIQYISARLRKKFPTISVILSHTKKVLHYRYAFVTRIKLQLNLTFFDGHSDHIMGILYEHRKMKRSISKSILILLKAVNDSILS